MIHLDAVHKRFALPGAQGWFEAVRSTNLHIEAGEIFGLIGHSGAGKSTLLRLINLLERPDGGAVRVGGEDLTALQGADLRRARQHIGMIFQQFNLMANRTVAGNVALALEIAGWSGTRVDDRVRECLDIVGLEQRARHYPAQLSGGQKQRVGIARALALQPKVMLADEPTSALDPQTTRSVLDCLRDVNQRFGVTIVIVTHEMPVVRKLCHRAAVMHDGQVLEIAPVVQGHLQTQTAQARELLAEDF
ncbi:MAG: ATP-binding cassette domain-containing protein [Brachymonas sp.]|nr:ATP-binding cassette domain-containing protein [Brachymonas sp.]